MAAKRLVRDPSLDLLLRSLRLAHRAYRESGHTGRHANVAAKRAAAVMAAEEAIWVREPLLSDHVKGRPTASAWRAARARLIAAYPQDAGLMGDLKRVRYNSDSVLDPDAIRDAVVRASLAYEAVIDGTRTVRATGPDSPAPRRSRREKDRLRAQARRDFEAVLAGLSVAVVAALNPDSDELHVLASGALTEG
jgi:hypothetical protein